MRIYRIEVKGLFGVFNHVIPMNQDDRITIIHGPNGFGKTILLKMLHSIFSVQYYLLLQIPFQKFMIDFGKDGELTVEPPNIQRNHDDRKGVAGKKITFRLKKGRAKPKTYQYKLPAEWDIDFPLHLFERGIKGLERIDEDSWVYSPTQERLSLWEVFYRFGDKLEEQFGAKFPFKLGQDIPPWLRQIKESISVRFIETQRLLSYSEFYLKKEFEKWPSMVPAVKKYSDELVNAIQAKLAEYATLSQSLDRSFPNRIIKEGWASEISLSDLKQKLRDLEEKRAQLSGVGLLDAEKEMDFKDLLKINEENRNVLEVYIEDVREKLGVFDELTGKIDLLVRILNSRFLYKKMSISKKEGFVFKTDKGRDLPPIYLSSGEQHELVITYELLFKVRPNTLILIDEPELSLHVVWQQQFLKDLQEIIKISKIDILIATHSPQIIHDRWDLTAELRG